MTSLVNFVCYLVTIAMGIIAIGRFLGWIKKHRLSYFHIQTIPLFNDIVKSLKDLQITYNSRPIGPNTYFVKLILYNSGLRDFEGGLLGKGLLIKLPKGYSLIDCSCSSNIEAMKLSWEKKSDSVCFFWELLKRLNGAEIILLILADDGINEAPLLKPELHIPNISNPHESKILQELSGDRGKIPVYKKKLVKTGWAIFLITIISMILPVLKSKLEVKNSRELQTFYLSINDQEKRQVFINYDYPNHEFHATEVNTGEEIFVWPIDAIPIALQSGPRLVTESVDNSIYEAVFGLTIGILVLFAISFFSNVFLYTTACYTNRIYSTASSL